MVTPKTTDKVAMTLLKASALMPTISSLPTRASAPPSAGVSETGLVASLGSRIIQMAKAETTKEAASRTKAHHSFPAPSRKNVAPASAGPSTKAIVMEVCERALAAVR